ncbi:MAG: zinc ribbon domain-containing protein [Treponema sp.]|nr:zinc ribbon domain-containing protein [Treponema sp.]
MFCIQCGAQLPEGSRFCFSCGASVHANGNNPPSGGKCKLLVECIKGSHNIGENFKIYIDGQFIKKLSNGELFQKILNNGKHVLYFTSSGSTRTPSFEFTGNNNEIKYSISGPPMMRRISAAFFKEEASEVLKILVNKLYETEPGSYNG